MTIAGTDVTDAIRQARIELARARRRAAQQVRVVMRERQRELAVLGNAVIEGRDIGTVVAPDAPR